MNVMGPALSVGTAMARVSPDSSLHALRLDQRVEYEGAPGLSLTIPAMAAVDDIGPEASR